MNNFVHFLRVRYRLYVWDYIVYTRMRGFKSFNDWTYHRMGFLECWLEPGFHRFWQIWNPGIAYFFHRLYVSLGGRQQQIFSTIAGFVINGFVHTLIFFMISGRWSVTVIVTFALFGFFVVLSKKLEQLLQQWKWPKICNLAINAALVIWSFDIGFAVNEAFFYQLNK